MIACVRLPALPVLAAVRQDPGLRGRPLVVGENAGRTVIAASIQARSRGVVPGMSLTHAEQCCPDAIVQPVDQVGTARVRQLLLRTLYRLTPEVEVSDAGYAFIDLRGSTWRWPDRDVLLETIDGRIRALLPARPALGLGATLFVSRLAADRAQPGAPRLVDDPASFLEPLPISCLPLDDEQREYVELLGLRTLGDLRRIPRVAFRRQFGLRALRLHDLAWGIDPRVIPPWRPPSRIEESTPLDPPLEDMEALQFVVRSLADRVGELLAAGGLGAREIVIRLDLDGSPPHRESVRYAYPLTTGQDLFDRIRGRLKRVRPAAPLERITLSVRHVEPAYVRQPGLLLRRDGLVEMLADAIGRLQEESRPELIQRVMVIADATPVPDRRYRLRPVTDSP
ncbi:MAG TPA: DNA polymerase Y family protein [Candidatus Limnocylindrales bacterium]|nr:DNA polymerase Y family protein [Candidatus Limnocylindrales bacterium]